MLDRPDWDALIARVEALEHHRRDTEQHDHSKYLSDLWRDFCAADAAVSAKLKAQQEAAFAEVAHTVETSTSPLYDACMAAADRGADALRIDYGRRVGYIGERKMAMPRWYAHGPAAVEYLPAPYPTVKRQGIVIPNPPWGPKTSITGERFIWVLFDDNKAFGCYPSRLVRL